MAYNNIERDQADSLYETWVDDTSGKRLDNNYLKLFMQLEEQIGQAMQRDRVDGHSRSRGWTPPPKGYADNPSQEGNAVDKAD